MRFYEENARSLIARDYLKLSWIKRCCLMMGVSKELSIMHSHETIHGDLHTGNLLYDAPEVLNGEPHTKAADIYSFAMIMYEMITGNRPFWYRPYNQQLALEICLGLRKYHMLCRFSFFDYIAYAELMTRCWDSDPKKRPDSQEIFRCFNQFANMVIDYVEKLQPFFDEKGHFKFPNKEFTKEEDRNYFTESEIKFKSMDFFIDDCLRLLNPPPEKMAQCPDEFITSKKFNYSTFIKENLNSSSQNLLLYSESKCLTKYSEELIIIKDI
ncbi:kinase-like domain-containing protein [Gigaspora rosea]|uniref:Kinase-like domain-containing protein n=1 Tax=Gigaspora rosea TaxID=44941 RepID=A0A397W0M6_9GLOM|nr:kinase-like domain-containing protein [Gigaspora rosea]